MVLLFGPSRLFQIVHAGLCLNQRVPHTCSWRQNRPSLAQGFCQSLTRQPIKKSLEFPQSFTPRAVIEMFWSHCPPKPGNNFKTFLEWSSLSVVPPKKKQMEISLELICFLETPHCRLSWALLDFASEWSEQGPRKLNPPSQSLFWKQREAALALPGMLCFSSPKGWSTEHRRHWQLFFLGRRDGCLPSVGLADRKNQRREHARSRFNRKPPIFATPISFLKQNHGQSRICPPKIHPNQLFLAKENKKLLSKTLRNKLQEKTQENHYFPCNLG